MIDTHLHLFSDRFSYPWMIGYYASLSTGPHAVPPEATGGVILVQAIADPDETGWLLSTAAADPRIAGVIGWHDLTGPDPQDLLQVALGGVDGAKLVGLRHQATDEADPNWLARPDVVATAQAASRTGLSVDLLVGERELPAAIKLVDAAPSTRFILDHAGNPGPEPFNSIWPRLTAELAQRPNVACKLSGLPARGRNLSWSGDTTDSIIDHIATVFGVDRCLWGSDWPVSSLELPYAANVLLSENLVAAHFGPSATSVFDSSARVWYRLPE